MTNQGLRLISLCFSTLLLCSSCGILAQTSKLIAEADIKSNEETILKRKDIVEYAYGFLGTKYRAAGKKPGGFDCSGFVYHVMKEFDIKMAASSGLQEKQGEKISAKEAQPGDLMFFRRSEKGRVFHVAIVAANDENGLSLIHSTSGRGVVLDRVRESSYWRSKVMTARKIVSTD